MAGLKPAPETRGQFAAIALVRWRLLVNSLRTLRGRLEMVSRAFLALGFSAAGLGGAAGMGFAAWAFVRQGRYEWLAVLLWPVFLFWQMFPVMATAFTENFDSSNLLRFPLTYRAYFFVRVLYGSLEPATFLGSLWLVGIALGIGFGESAIFLWSMLVLAAFSIFNVLLARTIFAWIERWLAQRRAREILGIVFFLFIISFQFIGPLANRYGGRAHPGVNRTVGQVLPFERLLPPGLAAASIAGAGKGEYGFALGALLILAGYTFGVMLLLDLRLRAQYHGESFSEAAAPVKSDKKRAVRAGWNLRGVPAPVAAILEKEFHSLLRSGPMLFTLIMPVVVLLIFRVAPGNSRGGEGFLTNAPDLAFPVGAAYALLIMNNLIYNNFGPEAGGIQFYFVSPVKFGEILLAKNLAHACVLACELLLVGAAVSLMFRPPDIGVTLATLVGILFAALVNFSVGNLLSIHAPKKVDFGTFGRQRLSNMTAFASLGIQLVVFGGASAAFFAGRAFGKMWLTTVLFLLLAVPALAFYLFVLKRVDAMAVARREALIGELCRT